MQKIISSFRSLIIAGAAVLAAFTASGCGGSRAASSSDSASAEPMQVSVPQFSADSALSYVKMQTDLGPRVPGTPAHAAAADAYVNFFRTHGAEVIEQKHPVTTFDGTALTMRNIFARFAPEAERRILLLAHYDCRPWADQDPDPAKHKTPVDGANDGASGVGVLMEIGRLVSANPLADGVGVDILLVDVEDWGTDEQEDSWAIGANYFAKNPPVEGYFPDEAILLDMVGAKDAVFPQEYFSLQAAPQLVAAVWAAADAAGYGNYFPQKQGGAVTDDHRPLIDVGIPAIDIIDYRDDTGFEPNWHTVSDTFANISKETLQAVGGTLARYLWTRE